MAVANKLAVNDRLAPGPQLVRRRSKTRAASRVPVEDAIDRGFGFLTSGDPLAALEAEHRAECAADARWRRCS